MSVCVCVRIAGDTALCKNIHESVSRQIRKNFAKSKWRVNIYRSLFSVVFGSVAADSWHVSSKVPQSYTFSEAESSCG